MNKPTWSNISNASAAAIEVKMPPQPPPQIDLKALCEVIDEGFRKHSMMGALEIADGLETIDKAILEHASQVDSACAGIIENQKDMLELVAALNSRLATLNLSFELCAKNIDMVEDNLPLIIHAIKGIKLDANIPITNLTIGMPRFVVWYAIASPIIFALGAILAMRHF